MEAGDANLNPDLLDQLRQWAQRHDQTGAWPELDLQTLAEQSSAMRWAVPREFGGDDVEPLTLHLRYEALAAASLATALILTQRDSAVGLIASGGNDELKRELLPKLAVNEIFATVGIAQLTTSRQGGAPAVRAIADNDGWLIEGVIPWCTGAAKAQRVVVGAATEARQQILVALSPTAPGVEVAPPMELVALRSSWTTELRCTGVRIEPQDVVAGPSASVLEKRPKSLPLGQAFLALGHARGIIHLIERHDSARGRALHKRLSEQLADLHAKIVAVCAPTAPASAAEQVPHLRSAATDLALRAAHSTVTLYKGSALLLSHPAQRLAREALFLLVWSCPDRVIECTVDLLSSGRLRNDDLP